MTNKTFIFLVANISFPMLVGSACGELDDLPAGPCNDDGATTGSEDEIPGPILSASLAVEPSADMNPTSPGDELRPPLPEMEGWMKAPGLNGLYRYATVHEIRRFKWPKHTLVLAAPFGILEEGPGTARGRASIRLPHWQANRANWARDEQGHVAFERHELPTLGTSVDIDHPGLDNNTTWEAAFASKHSYPRSSGWYWTGCYEVDDVCAPLGKPGWSCEQAWCEPQ